MRGEIVVDTQELAKLIRIHILKMANRASTSHVGSCLSCTDILAVLYGEVMRYRVNKPDWDGRNRFILSKGHAVPTLYAVLAESGYFSDDELKNLREINSMLQGHPVCSYVQGIEASTGSLGHGLSFAHGVALYGK